MHLTIINLQGEGVMNNKAATDVNLSFWKHTVAVIVIELLVFVFLLLYFFKTGRTGLSGTSQSPGPSIVWFYFAFFIGSFFVFIAIHHVIDDYLTPLLADLRASNGNEGVYDNGSGKISQRVVVLLYKHVIPAVVLQVLIITLFWMTIVRMPYNSLYTQSFMYGQIYYRLNALLEHENANLGFTVTLDNMSKDIVNRECRRSASLYGSFGSYLDWNKIRKGDFGITDTTAAKESQDKKGKSPGHNNNLTELCGGVIDNLDSNYSKLCDGGLADKQMDYSRCSAAIIKTIYKIPFGIALTFGFLGALMYILKDCILRFFIGEIYPKTFISYSIRFIFSPALCMVIAYFWMVSWSPSAAPIAFFLVGFFPQKALQFIEEKARRQLNLNKEEHLERPPLEGIQGMSDYTVYRLSELGINNAHGLAYCDLNRILGQWSNKRQLCDFVSQALLLVHLPRDFSKLQNSSLRNIVAFRETLGGNPDVVPVVDFVSEYARSLEVSEESRNVLEVSMRGLLNLSWKPPLSLRIDWVKKLSVEYDKKEENAIKRSTGNL